ncbi:hypothetical protein NSA50_02270 [Clostridium sp. DSM 100503]|uniref:DUF6897 domain-containing protein n=1 Tax=Clostridium sp. DSM 100503 TaxID=2963282 RepID=UPI00214A3796|nr:hypothetical protein [Clostridium sp. DSM 100503]MCR1949884.1 hypothetical protein [Clostridium sp. DSM 100503]
MYELISRCYKGVSITVALTGLPLLITGEVFETKDNIVGLRLKDNRTVYISAEYIAFFY